MTALIRAAKPVTLRERLEALRVAWLQPAGLVDDGSEPLLAAQIEDVLKLGIHRLALFLGQVEPGVKQRIRLGFLHGREVQIGEQLPLMEIAGQQGIGYLPEAVPGGVVPGHASLLSRIVLNPLDDMGCCSTLQYIYSRSSEPRGAMATTKTTTLTFRIEPALKEALRTAAEQEYRSIANMVAVLIMDYCDKKGIPVEKSKQGY